MNKTTLPQGSSSAPNAPSAWGEAQTKFFFELTPEHILEAVESVGIRTTGRVLALNSMENRVYEVEIELDEKPRTPSERFRIVKFYRPGRWSEQQIREEHRFLFDLVESEIPVVAPLRLDNGESLKQVPGVGIWFAVFPKVGGRSPDELDDEKLERVGRLLARMHGVGAAAKAPSRISLTPEVYGLSSLTWLEQSGALPPDIAQSYSEVVREICALSSPVFAETRVQRIHGDCHFGNLLWSDRGPFWVDFDDMVNGPCVQDLWLIIPGRDDYAKRQMSILLSAYREMRDFDQGELRLVEALRALRFVHFSAWISRRWADPAFPRVFSHFGSSRWWTEQLHDLRQQLVLVREQCS